MKRRTCSPLLMLKRFAAMAAATIYLTGCGIEIVDVTAPTSVTGGQPFEIEVTQQFSNSADNSEIDGTRWVFAFVVPEGWAPQAGGSYDAEFDGVSISLSVEALNTIESSWNDVLFDPALSSPCVPVEDPVDPEQCALYKALDAIEFVPFFYGGQYPPPDDTTYQLLYVRTELLPPHTVAADDTAVLTMPFVAGALQPAENVPFIVALAAELSEEAAEIARERLPADQQEHWPSLGAGAVDEPEDADVTRYVFWLWGENDGLTAEIDGYEVPMGSVGEASVMQFARSLPVPIGGPALFTLIALGLLGLGISAGRKRRRKI